MNHDDQVVDTERFNISQEIEDVTLESMQPAEQEVAKRLTTSIVNTYLDTKDIAFERQVTHLLTLTLTLTPFSQHTGMPTSFDQLRTNSTAAVFSES